MRGKDSDSQNEKSLPVFNGVDGVDCHELVQIIRQYAFDEGKSRDNAWMADVAALRFRGPALKWLNNLDDATQEDWSLLKRAILRQYAEPTYEEAMSEPSTMPTAQSIVFKGDESDDVRQFIRLIRQRAFTAGKLHDDAWMADLACTCFLGDAFEWHSMLAPNIRSSWEHLERVLMESFSSPLVRGWGPAAKRISIRNWENGVKASDLKLPRSEEDWLAAGRQRKAELRTSVSWSLAWYLVEAGEQIPAQAIQTGSAENKPLFSIRVWKEGNLTLGKCSRHHSHGYVPWYGKELPWSGPYEILVGDQNAIRWVSPAEGNFIAVEGGYEAASTAALLIAQSQMGDTVMPGKAFSGGKGAYIGWWWNEHWKWNDEVRILAWAI